MRYFKFNNLNEATITLCRNLIENGDRIPSRNGDTLEIINPTIEFTDPRNRHLYLKGRTSNIYASIIETIWVLAGKSELEPLMNLALPRAKNYSDDGVTWRGSYGPRLYKNGSLDHIIQMFLKDGINTRRACLSIWHPDLDTISSINDQGYPDSKDYPCNNFIYFWIRDYKLNMKVTLRSNDVLFGLSAINVFEWTTLMECVYRMLINTGKFGGLNLGSYFHNPISLHLYDETSKQAYELLSKENIDENALRSEGNYYNHNIILPIHITNQELLRMYFESLYKHLIEMKPIEMLTPAGSLQNYCNLALGYIRSKNGLHPGELPKTLSPDLKEAIKNSKFTPEEWLNEC